MIDLNALPHRKEGEQTVYLLRRHWIVPLKIAGIFLLGLTLLVGGYLLSANEFPGLYTHPLGQPVMALVGSFILLALWLIVMQEFVDYYLDTWIVTNERVIDIAQKGLFKRTSAELHLENIVDVTSEVKGMLPTFLNYGDLMIQTAGEKVRFRFEQIPRPEEVRQTVLKLVDEDRHRHESQTH